MDLIQIPAQLLVCNRCRAKAWIQLPGGFKDDVTERFTSRARGLEIIQELLDAQTIDEPNAEFLCNELINSPLPRTSVEGEQSEDETFVFETKQKEESVS